jgi:hypothetical protein
MVAVCTCSNRYILSRPHSRRQYATISNGSPMHMQQSLHTVTPSLSLLRALCLSLSTSLAFSLALSLTLSLARALSPTLDRSPEELWATLARSAARATTRSPVPARDRPQADTAPAPAGGYQPLIIVTNQIYPRGPCRRIQLAPIASNWHLEPPPRSLDKGACRRWQSTAPAHKTLTPTRVVPSRRGSSLGPCRRISFFVCRVGRCFTVPHSDGVCGVGTARRLPALPPCVRSSNLSSASGRTGQGRVRGGSSGVVCKVAKLLFDASLAAMGDAADGGGSWPETRSGAPPWRRCRTAGPARQTDLADDGRRAFGACKVPAPQTKHEIRLRGPADEPLLLGTKRATPTPYTLPTPYTRHPKSHETRYTYILHPTPYLHPTPGTLHPTPYTLHPTPYTLTVPARGGNLEPPPNCRRQNLVTEHTPK